ncbi:lysophospholipase L2 [Clostridium puniceum]|uniref:Lysophospholipase L2 n=1 Tax=Clostridium puniceum TaxID=29367 RepID=A0A1S8T2D6_9CLOT|nr:lysophospholipase L2 [Clostridium puniceum]
MKKYNKSVVKNFKIILMMFILIFQLFYWIGYSNLISNAAEIENTLDEIYISENNYTKDMTNIVEPYINNALESGYVDGDEDIKLYYEKYKVKDAKGNIVLCHGYTESLERYHELSYYFMKNGYNVFGVEHRGHAR